MDKFAETAISRLGGTNETAKFFDVTPGAVSQWRESGVPPARKLELMERNPTVFKVAMLAERPEKQAA